MSVGIVRRALPVLTREAAACRTRLSRPRARLVLQQGWTLEDAACAGREAGDWCRVGIVLSAAPPELSCELSCQLSCPWDLFGRILDTLPAGVEADQDTLALLLALALDPLLCAMEAAGGPEVTVLSVSRTGAPPPGAVRALTLHVFDRPWPLLLAGADEALDAALRRWPAAAQPADEVVLDATLRLGTTGLTLGVLRSLGIDDVVLMETRRGHGRAGTLVVAGHLLAPAGWSGRGWTLEAAPAAAHTNRKEWLGMTELSAHDAGDEASHEDDIPVTVCFDLGRLEMTLGELRRLGPGAVLELPGTADAAVSLTVGGRCVGVGELVEVAGHSGVRVLRVLGRG